MEYLFLAYLVNLKIKISIFLFKNSFLVVGFSKILLKISINNPTSFIVNVKPKRDHHIIESRLKICLCVLLNLYYMKRNRIKR